MRTSHNRLEMRVSEKEGGFEYFINFIFAFFHFVKNEKLIIRIIFHHKKDSDICQLKAYI